MAKPLLNSSEESYASVCINYEDTPERLIRICQLALKAPGISAAQRQDMRDSLANAFMQENRLDESEAEFAGILSEQGNSTRALKGLGWVAHERKDFAKARDFFQESLDIGATAPALAGLGDSLWELREITADEAIVYMDGARALDPDYGWARRQKGWILLDAKRPEAAISAFDEVIDEFPEDVNARAGLVEANLDLYQFNAALEHTNRVLGETPDYYWFLSKRADVLLSMGRYKQAIRDAERLIALEPENSEGYVRKARPMAMLGARAEALGLLADAETRTGPDAFLIYWRASILIDDDQYEKALAQIERNTLGDDPDHFDFELLSLLHILRQDHRAARVAVDRAMAFDRNEPYPIFYDAILMLREKKGVQVAMERFDDAMLAGLSDSGIGEFASELVEAGYIVHAIAIRAKYSD